MIVCHYGARYLLGYIVHIDPERLEVTPYQILEEGATAENAEEGGNVCPELAGKRILRGEKKVFALADLKAERNWGDCTLWNMAVDATPPTVRGFFNRAAVTLPARAGGLQFSRWGWGGQFGLLLLAADAGMTFTDMDYEFLLAEGHPLVCNLPARKAETNFGNVPWPLGVTISGPDTLAPGEEAEYTLRVTSPGTDKTHPRPVRLLLSADAGYLPLRAITAEGESTAFRVHALGLRTGEHLRLKVGTKFWSGLGEKEITVGETR